MTEGGRYPMDYIYYATDYSNSLYHHGIHGMHWGVRRFQNPDGSLTTEVLKRRRKGVGQVLSEHKLNSLNKKMTNASKKFDDYYDKASNAQQQSNYYQSKMTEAQANYALAKANKQKHENSLGAKVIGVNKSKLNKYDKQMEDAQNDYNENEALKLIANAEMQKMAILGVDAEKEYAYYEDKAMKQINKYLDKYGEESMDEFMKKHNDASDELSSAYAVAKADYDKKNSQNNKAILSNKVPTYEEVTKLEKERDNAYDKLESYRNKNNSYWPDEDGPMYKSYEDFTKGIIDNEGTRLAKALDSAEEKYQKADEDYWDNELA